MVYIVVNVLIKIFKKKSSYKTSIKQKKKDDSWAALAFIFIGEWFLSLLAFIYNCVYKEKCVDARQGA